MATGDRPPDGESPAGLPYRADIDGLRAVAVTAVVVFHAFPGVARGGFSGVDVFFVISGYLISSLIWDGLAGDRFSLAGFYKRRALRLFPALVVVLTACLVAGWWLLLPADYARLGKDAAAAAGYVSNFVFWNESGYFAPAASLRPMTHLWSLAVEEQFYLLYPLLLIAVFRRRGATAALIVVLAVVSFGVNLAQVHTDAAAAYYLLPARFWELLLGGLLAYAHIHARLRWSGRLADLLSIAGVAMLAVSFLGPSGSSLYPGWWALAPTAAAVLLIAAGPAAAVNRHVLSWPPVVLVGRFSYPLYLWHFPVLVFARLRYGAALPAQTSALLVLASVALAYLTYRFVERPIRRRRLRPRRRIVPALAAMMAAVAVGGIVVNSASGVPARLPFPAQKLVSFKYDFETAWRVPDCFIDAGKQDASDFAPRCIDGGGADRGPLVLLWGDSHAAHLYPGLRSLQRDRRFRLAELTSSSCPPFLGHVQPDRRYCAQINPAILARVRRLHPATVILSAAWDQYSDDGRIVRTVDALKKAGVPRVVIVGPSPKWPQGMPQSLYAYYRKKPGRGIPRRFSFGLSSGPRKDAPAVRALARRSGARYVDPLAVLCNADGCLARVGDRIDELTIWDSAHFTTAGSSYVARAVAGTVMAGIPRR